MLPACRLQGRIENPSGGMLESAAKISPNKRAPRGVMDAGFKTNGQPAAMAGAIL